MTSLSFRLKWDVEGRQSQTDCGTTIYCIRTGPRRLISSSSRNVVRYFLKYIRKEQLPNAANFWAFNSPHNHQLEQARRFLAWSARMSEVFRNSNNRPMAWWVTAQRNARKTNVSST